LSNKPVGLIVAVKRGLIRVGAPVIRTEVRWTIADINRGLSGAAV